MTSDSNSSVNNHKNSEIIHIYAPMSGTVVEMNTSFTPGARFNRGEELLTLERMKLLCPVSAPHPGIVTAVNVKIGSKVLKGEVLLQGKR